MTREVYAPGERVLVADGSIEAIVDCVAIYAHGGVLYEMAWWIEGSRHSAWLSEQELVTECEKVAIGFKSN